jgi:outer membrane protein assembly factor BamA
VIRFRAGALAFIALTGLCEGGNARAADPLNSSNRPVNGDASKSSAPRNEFNVVPVGGGTTDIGIGGGYFAGFARVQRGVEPYVWNLESSGFLTFAPGDGGGLALPYQDLNLKLTVPRFAGSTMQLEIRSEYSWETTLNYFGLGNASSAALPAAAPHKYFMYGRLHPELEVDLRWRIVDHLDGRIGVRYTQNWLQVADNSKLAGDFRAGSEEVKGLLGSTAMHGVAVLHYGIQWDTRDNDVSTHRGRYDSLNVMLSPGGAGTFLPYQYAEATATTRVFIPIWKSRVTLAGRLVADVLYGHPPFYELSRFDGTYAIGGLYGVRGVPGQRYYGKVKALGNVELRTEIVSFHALGKLLLFGIVGFFDAGRVWADIGIHPELDGKGIGLKYGVGGGVRIQSGSAFVIRADVAWSPDASPVGGYFAAGQMF